MLLLSATGSANEKTVVSDAFEGNRAYQFVINTIADSGAYRIEGQSHPESDDIFKGNTVWIGYAIKVPANLPTDPHLLRTHQIKHLDPQCQVSLGVEDDQWKLLEEYGLNCGGVNKGSWVDAPLNKGSWQTVVVEHVLTNSGRFRVWIDNADESNPTLQITNRPVYGTTANDTPCYVKLGLYEGWWRVNPQDVISARWTATYDNIRVCRGDMAGCGFWYVYPQTSGSCGDGTCGGGETCETCAGDCGVCPACGDGTCDPGESCDMCAADCGACPTCGDASCGASESCDACPADCGVCPGCGDGTCDLDETCSGCPDDCGPACLGLRAEACHVDTPPPVDGDPSDWPDITPLAVSHTRSIADAAEPCASDADCSAVFKTAWDADNLYVVIEVTDDTVVDDSAALYLDDGVEIYLDGGNEKSSSYDSNDFQLSVTVGDEVDGNVETATGFTHATTSTVAGYVIEYAVPWNSLGVTPGQGTVIGFDLAINDDDNGGNTRESQLVWNGDGDGWRDPRQLGEFILDTIACDTSVNLCGNGVCDTNESSATCPQDCESATCGDGACDASESAVSCPEDCQTASCGDGTCDTNEGTSTCPQDCPDASCGNGVCGPAESCSSCAADCGACPVAGDADGSGDSDALYRVSGGCNCHSDASTGLLGWIAIAGLLVAGRRRRAR